MKYFHELKNINFESVYLTEKIDGSALIICRENGELVFYNRNKFRKLDLVRRIVFDFYEPAIQWLTTPKIFIYLERILPNEGDEIHFEFFPHINHSITKYKRLPKHNLVLLRYTYEENIMIYNIARKLEIDYISPFYSGYPTPQQIELLKADDISIGTIQNNFNKEFKPLLGGELEGIVVYTKNNQIFKIMTRKFKERFIQKKEDTRRLEYQKIFTKMLLKLRICNIINNISLSKEENYLQIIFNIISFNLDWILKYRENFKQFNYGYLFPSIADIKRAHFPDYMIQYMRNEKWFKDFICFVITHLYEPKKRATKLFSKENIKEVNKMIEIIRA